MRHRVDCHACRHYHVTWDARFPHACRRMGFKSSRYPSDEVRLAMEGESCRLFEPRRPRLRRDQHMFPAIK